MAAGVGLRTSPSTVDQIAAADASVDAPGRPPVALPHEPALDGMRGLAVAVVVLFHLDRLQGGFLGVDLFFVLSGFLITALLATEHRRTGTTDLGAFWARRARRLLPALVLMMVGVGALLLRFTPEGVRAGYRGDALATLGYVANWHRMANPLDYWALFTQPSPFDHTWSLAIEEQFYVVWPIVTLLALAWGRRHGATVLTGMAVAGAVVSFSLLAMTYVATDTNRAYFGTDTRLGPTLLGASLALLTVRRPRRATPPRPAVELAGVAALAWMAWSVTHVDGLAPWYYRGGLATFALAAVVAVAAVTGGPPGLLARLLSWRPLRLLGAISYGVYLWHWPVIVFVTGDRAGVRGGWLDLLRVVLTLGLAVTSYVLVEQPVRRGALRAPQLRMAAVGGLAVALVAVVVSTGGSPTPSGPAATAATAPATSEVAGEPASRDLLGVANSFIEVPGELPDGRARLLLVGDSGAGASGPAFIDAAERAGHVGAFATDVNCSPVYGTDTSRRSDGEAWHRECPPGHRQALWTDLVDQYDPDVVIYYLANAGWSQVEESLDGAWVQDCDAAYRDHLSAALLADFELLGRGGARLVLATSHYSQWSDDELLACRNDTYRRVVASDPSIQLVDLHGFVAAHFDRDDPAAFSDVAHLSPEASAQAAAWLLEQIPATREGASP